MKIKQTTRKFYNKWSYKLSFFIKGLGSLRSTDLSVILNKSKNLELTNFLESINNLNPNDYAKRLENNCMDIYTNDKKIFDDLSDRFRDHLKSASVPSEDFENSIKDSHSILAKKLPHNRFRYKIYLQPHRIKSAEDRKKYIDWLETQKPRINITDTVKTWFYKTHWNWDRRYMYVEDEHTLLILKLKNSEALGTVYSFVVSDK